MNEHGIQNTIRNALVGKGSFFRGNVGKGWTGKAERVAKAGFAKVEPGDVIVRKARVFDTGLPPGFSDLFGLRSVVITPDMVGQTIAQFVAMEVKTDTGRASDRQGNFLAAVRARGGLAGIVRSPDDALALIGADK